MRGQRGQLYILAAFFIFLVISEVANVAYYSSLPAEAVYASVDPAPQIADSIVSEIVYIKNSDPRANVSNFTMFAQNFSTEKNYATRINSSTGGKRPSSTCDFYANATAATLTNHTDYTVNVTSTLAETTVVKTFRICWRDPSIST